MATADEQQFASFIMLCIGADFSSKLWIPAKFVRKYRQIAKQASVMVESDDGRFWEVEIEDMNGELLIKDGWSEVVKDNNISELDLLTFRLLGDSNFKLSIYTPYCCPRDPPPPPISGGGDEMSNKTPSFFKALSNTDFTKILRVPPVFMEKYGLTPPENAKLRVRNSGRTWDVKVERSPENGLFCFTKGWRIFAEDAGLQLNEFLVLSLVREWEFDVVIYDTDDMCEREIADGTNVERETNKHRCFDRSDPLYFEVCMRPYQRSRISLGKKFVKAAGFGGRKSVMVKHVEKCICISVAIAHRRHARGCRVDLGRGWSDFREANGLEPGKTYSFRFDPIKDLILVNEIKKRN